MSVDLRFYDLDLLIYQQGSLDESEMKYLVYCALCFFCVARDPDMSEPPREQCEPFVNNIMQNLMPTLDTKGDGILSRDDFGLFGEYLNDEYAKLQKEMAAQRSTDNNEISNEAK